MKKFSDYVLVNEISSSTFERMDGLVSRKHLASLKEMFEQLGDEGFERKEVVEFIDLQ